MDGPDSTANDTSLIRQVQFGSAEQAADAVEQLVQCHGARLERYVRARGLSYDEQQDICNETWTRAWRQLSVGHYEDRGAGLFAWLRGIADYVIREHDRRRYYQVEEFDSVEHVHKAMRTLRCISLDHTLPETEDSFATADPAPAVLRKLTHPQLRAAIEETLRDAKEDFRTVIECHFFAEFTTEEIVQYTGWSVNKLYTTKHRALAWLKRQLLARYGEETVNDWRPEI